MKNKLFVDTSYVVALASQRDNLHDQAHKIALTIMKNKTKLLTTRAVVVEIGNALSRMQYRKAAVQLLETIETDRDLEVVELSRDLYMQSLNLFKNRMDKDWGLTDCISFIVMEQKGITEALTADEHFRQAGFRTLLS